MDDTITSSDSGVATEATQPQDTNTEAVTLGEPGSPTLRPKVAPTSSPQAESTDEAASEPTSEPLAQETTTEAQAEDSDIKAWAEKKGIDLKNADPEKLAQMVRESEKRMHEAIAKGRELETTMVQNPNLDYTGNEAYDALAMKVNQMEIQNRVESYFRTNPEARNYESAMAEIVQARPHLQNDLDALYALAANSPDRAAELKTAGGREALTNLAQKQSAVPPQSNASTQVATSKEVITSENVDDLVAKNGQEWFKKNYAAINKALAA